MSEVMSLSEEILRYCLSPRALSSIERKLKRISSVQYLVRKGYLSKVRENKVNFYKTTPRGAKYALDAKAKRDAEAQ